MSNPSWRKLYIYETKEKNWIFKWEQMPEHCRAAALSKDLVDVG